MTTERQIAANRANAKRSTGPKSRAGKARASQNAYRHGLTASMTMDADRVNALAREIQASMWVQIDRAGALAIAQAELQVSRVHKLASELFAKKPIGFAKHRPATGSQGWKKQAARRQGPAEKPGSTAGDLALLEKLDRYLGRVAGKRDRAMLLALEHSIHPE
jgi:hypothetical protein